MRTTEALRQLATDRRDAYDALTRDRRLAEDRIRTDVAAFLTDAGPERAGTAGSGQSTHSVTDHGDTVGDVGWDVTEDVDLARPDVLRARLASLLAGVIDSATPPRHGASDGTRQACRGGGDPGRWEQWRVDVADARRHPDESRADAELLVAVDRARTVATLSTSLDAWRSATEELVKLDDERTRLQSAVDEVWIDGPERSELGSPTTAHLLAATVAAEAASLEEADRRVEELRRRATTLAEDERSAADRSRALERAIAAVEGIRVEVTGAETAIANSAERSARRHTAEVLVERLERDAAALAARVAADVQLHEAVGALGSVRVRLTQAEEASVRLGTAWRAGLAGRIAAHLEDGAPCPTCGATEHPSPAAPADDMPTDEELEAAEALVRSRADEERALDIRVAELRARIATLPPVVDGPDVGDRLAAARTELADIRAADAAHADHVDTLDRLRADLADATAAIALERSALDGLAGALAERRTRWDEDRDEFVARHGSVDSTESGASRRRYLSRAITELACNLEATAAATSVVAQQLTVMAPTLAEFGVDDPAGLTAWAMTDAAVRSVQDGVDRRTDHRRTVTARIASYVSDGGPDEAPSVEPSLQAERGAIEAHDRLVGRVRVDVRSAGRYRPDDHRAGRRGGRGDCGTARQGGGRHPGRTVRRPRSRARCHPPLPQELGARLLPAPGTGPRQPPSRHDDQRSLLPRTERGAR